MLVVAEARDLARHVGEDLGPSGWITVDQAMIDGFARVTGDDQWIHVDVGRARRELGAPIAHGYLVLALLPRMLRELYAVRDLGRSLNYGSNRVRFVSPVAAGARIRLAARIAAVEEAKDGGTRITTDCTVEIAGAEKPALVAEIVSVAYP